MSEAPVSVLERSPVNPNDFRHEMPVGEFGKTIMAIRRTKRLGFFEESDKDAPNGYFQGRPIIGRDTKINGGVYVGSSQREAIVVDDTKQPELLRIYQQVLDNSRIQGSSQVDKSRVLGIVNSTVISTLRYDEARVNNITTQYPDKKVSLGSFVSERIGVCRHQALLGAYLLEKFKKDGHIQGKVSVDRNFVRGKGGHAWVRYTNSEGEVYIIDPAQKYLGRLKDINEERWFYERPEDFNPRPRWRWPWGR